MLANQKGYVQIIRLMIATKIIMITTNRALTR